jgi:hypothetical protein
VFAAREIASVGVLLAAGVWADRMRRERLMVGSNLVSFAAQCVTGVLLVDDDLGSFIFNPLGFAASTTDDAALRAGTSPAPRPGW